MKKIHIILFLLVPYNLIGSVPDHWESILSKGSLCYYLVPDSPLDPEWTLPGFDDAAWNSGPGGVGYGDDDDGTIIGPAISVYCRYHFNLTDPQVISALLLDVDFDDGFVAYLNGTEVAREYMGLDGRIPRWDQQATGLHEAGLPQGIVPARYTIEEYILKLLTPGENILSIEVHNENSGSSDLSSNVFLHAGIATDNSYFSDPPAWFYPPIAVDSSLLPLMIIDTEGQQIPNEPRITARMGLIHNNTGLFNFTADPFNVYNGQISIEQRGESSLWLYPKKSYSIETQKDDGTNNNVSLLDLPEENDFVLYAPYGDKSLIRNVITYRLFEKFGHYSPRTRFVELMVNNDYKGVYVLVEKIKRDKNRVDMAKLIPEDISDIDISGGYLLRIDKTTALDPQQYWESSIQPPVAGYGKVIYQYFDPEYDELTIKQQNYIRGHLFKFEQAMVSSDFTNPGTGYRSFLDIPSFIDLMILNEFSKDVDAFRLSHYFYKQKDTNGGKLVSGPPWDYNYTYGNSDFTPDIHLTENWTYTYTNTIYWWPRVMQDPWFRNQLYCRWDELHDSILSPGNLSEMIDSTIEYLGDAISRNFKRWPIFNTYIWPNSYVSLSYDAEIMFLRSWILDRLLWIDEQWGGKCIPLSQGNEQVLQTPGTLLIYPNPSDLSQAYISLDGYPASGLMMRLYDINGRLIHQSSLDIQVPQVSYQLPDLSYLPDGMYTLEVSDGIGFINRGKLIKQ